MIGRSQNDLEERVSRSLKGLKVIVRKSQMVFKKTVREALKVWKCYCKMEKKGLLFHRDGKLFAVTWDIETVSSELMNLAKEIFR